MPISIVFKNAPPDTSSGECLAITEENRVGRRKNSTAGEGSFNPAIKLIMKDGGEVYDAEQGSVICFKSGAEGGELTRGDCCNKGCSMVNKGVFITARHDFTTEPESLTNACEGVETPKDYQQTAPVRGYETISSDLKTIERSSSGLSQYREHSFPEHLWNYSESSALMDTFEILNRLCGDESIYWRVQYEYISTDLHSFGSGKGDLFGNVIEEDSGWIKSPDIYQMALYAGYDVRLFGSSEGISLIGNTSAYENPNDARKPVPSGIAPSFGRLFLVPNLFLTFEHGVCTLLYTQTVTSIMVETPDFEEITKIKPLPQSTFKIRGRAFAKDSEPDMSNEPWSTSQGSPIGDLNEEEVTVLVTATNNFPTYHGN